MGHRFCVKFGTVRIGSAYDNNNVLGTVLIDDVFDAFLTLQVNRTRSSSDKALGLHEQGLCPCTLDACGNGRTLYPIPFTENNNFLAS
jgi:hypothetical protein